MGDKPLLTPPTTIPPSLDPLRNSWDFDQAEAELKEAFIEVFEAMIRPRLQRINTYGLPHRGTFEVVKRFVKAEGLVLERKAGGDELLRELFRGWRARNPRRGLHFLRFYLQLLFPGQWRVEQLWQDPAQSYPEDASPTQADGAFLTSRVRVTLLSDDATGDEMTKLFGSLRAVLAAKYVLELVIERSADAASTVRLAAGADIVQMVFFSGTAAP